MAAIPFPTSSSPGVHSQESDGRIINGYAEKQGNTVIHRRSPGRRELVNATGHSHCRGLIAISGLLLTVYNERAYAVSLSGETFSTVNLGALAGTLPVTIARNMAATPNIACVTENGAFNLFTGSAPTNWADADLPQPNSVSELDGYFLFTIGDGRIFASDLNSVSVSALSFTTESARPGALLRGISFGGRFFAMKEDSIGVYRDAATSPFPLEKETTIPKGLAGTHAVAGWETGWANALLWVGEDSVVYRLNGNTPEPVSTHDVSRAIESAADHGLLEADVYMAGGHAFWRLTSPGEWTWVYDLMTQEWTEARSFNRNDFLASRSIRAFDRWIVGDRLTGKLFQVDEGYYKDGPNPLIWQIESSLPPTFPARSNVARADFNFVRGTGVANGEDPIQTDPYAEITMSKDGGATWGTPYRRRLGSQGQYHNNVTVLNMGPAYSPGPRFRIRISDPVHVAFKGAEMALQGRTP